MRLAHLGCFHGGFLFLYSFLKFSFNVLHAVAWNTDWKTDDEKRSDETKLRLEDFYPEYSKQAVTSKENYGSLIEYLLYYDDKKKTLESIRKHILNAVINILRFEKKVDVNNRYFTKRKFLDYLGEYDRRNKTDCYDVFNLNLYKWSINIIRRQQTVLPAIQTFIEIFLSEVFDIKQMNDESKKFLYANEIKHFPTQPEGAYQEPVIRLPNKYIDRANNITIDICSVHSVKGQTHTSTLYFESSYHTDYESGRLLNQFLGNDFKEHDKVRHKESDKMVYVGFSRPTHLLCVAIHKERFEQNKSFFEADKNNWKIEYCYLTQ